MHNALDLEIFLPFGPCHNVYPLELSKLRDKHWTRQKVFHQMAKVFTFPNGYFLPIFTFTIIKEIASGWLKEETWFTRQNGIVQWRLYSHRGQNLRIVDVVSSSETLVLAQFFLNFGRTKNASGNIKQKQVQCPFITKNSIVFATVIFHNFFSWYWQRFN